jgi:hypothetical protein
MDVGRYPRSCNRQMLNTCIDACRVSVYGDHKETVATISLYTAILVLGLGVVRELLRPVVCNLLSGRNPDRSRSLRGDIVHELSLCQRCERSRKSKRAHLGQRRETTGFTNDSTVKTNRLSGISSILTLRWSEMG